MNKEKMRERAEKTAEFYRRSTLEDSDRPYILSEILGDELTRAGFSYEENLESVQETLRLIKQQKPRTKKERLKDVLKNKNFFTVRTINIENGNREIAWNERELENYCKMEGVEIQEFLDWSIFNKEIN